MSLTKLSVLFAVACVSAVREQLLTNCQERTRISRKDFLEQYEEDQREAISACLDSELICSESYPDREFDTMKGPGGGIGLKGAPRGEVENRSVTLITVTPVYLERVTQCVDRILEALPRGFNAQMLAVQLVDNDLSQLKPDSVSQASAALAHLVADNKLEHKPAVGYRRPRPVTPKPEASASA